MRIPATNLLFRAFGAAALGLLACWPSMAHHARDPLETAATAPAVGAPEERLTGLLRRLTIDDRVAGLTLDVYSLELDDGTAVPLKGAGAPGLAAGARVEVSGRRNGKTLFASGMRQLTPPPAGAADERKRTSRRELEGKLALLHADHFEEARSEFIFELHGASATPTTLRFHVVPEALHAGMDVRVTGTTAADGEALEPETVAVLALPPPKVSLQELLAKAPTTNNVLVILMTFTDSPAIPFSQAQVQSVFAGGPGTGSVAQYFSEVSFGQQFLNPIVTPWLSTNAATPAGCNWQQMGTLGRNAASAAGYNVASYQNVVYVFPQANSCGWLGLAYVGASGVWINGRNSTSVYGHELGHNFGLLHAGSLRCSGAAIGGACNVSEYGDPFDIMGNQSAMHFNVPQKLDLGWIGTGTVITHGAGTGTYVLNPVETAGGGLYAVRIPVAANRTYWLEYRQPIGFDAALAGYPNNGAQVRVVSPFETLCSGCDSWSNDTQLLDMTPATSTFTDAALVVGKSFADSTYGINISVLAATSSALTVRVSAPGGTAATSTSLTSSPNPASAGVGVTFTATVTGSAPTGNVGFAANGATMAGCGAVGLITIGNVGTATCTSSNLPAGTHSIVASYGGNAGNTASVSAPLSQVINAPPPTPSGTDVVWVEDALPAGAVAGSGEGWSWRNADPAPLSGTLAHQSALAAGPHQHVFTGATATLAVAPGDTLYTYVYLDPANPPTEVMLQWHDGVSFAHRAYWGANSIPRGTDGTASRRYIGPLPATGKWVRLEVPAAQVGLEGKSISGMGFLLYGGRATWDRAGRAPGTLKSTVWLDDALPQGAVTGVPGGWTWTNANPAPFSGALAHESPLTAGLHRHVFKGASTTLSVVTGDTLYAYVYLDPVNPPTEVMLQWHNGVSWAHGAYWGANTIAFGTDGTASRRYMGPLPAPGKWVRLEVPAAQVGLEGKTVSGMAFALYAGRAMWDYVGK